MIEEIRHRGSGQQDRPTPVNAYLIVGNPGGKGIKVGRARVQALRLMVGNVYIQLRAAVNPGNSGGPLLDARGRVIGIVSMKLKKPDQLGLALSINHVFTHYPQHVSAPGRHDRREWDKLVQRAENEDEDKATQTANALDQPRIVRARISPRHRLEVWVVQANRPPAPTLAFEVVVGERQTCAPAAQLVGTKRVAGREKVEKKLGLLFGRWMRDHNLVANIYVGRYDLDPADCQQANLRGARLSLSPAPDPDRHVAIE